MVLEGNVMRINFHKFFLIFIFLSGSINVFVTPKNRFILSGALGLVLENQAKAYALVELSKTFSVVKDEFSSQSIQVRYNNTSTGRCFCHALQGIILFWLAWYVFHP